MAVLRLRQLYILLILASSQQLSIQESGMSHCLLIVLEQFTEAHKSMNSITLSDS